MLTARPLNQFNPFTDMRTQLKIEKRIQEELEGIRKIAALLPSGKANALLNKCSKIGSYARKAQALVDSPQGCLFPNETHAGDITTNEDIAARYNAKKAVFEAMTRGRRVSLEDEEEFRTREMHTTICYIRKDIEAKNLPWVLCDREIRPDPSRRGYKQWWLIPKEEPTNE